MDLVTTFDLGDGEFFIVHWLDLIVVVGKNSDNMLSLSIPCSINTKVTVCMIVSYALTAGP